MCTYFYIVVCFCLFVCVMCVYGYCVCVVMCGMCPLCPPGNSSCLMLTDTDHTAPNTHSSPHPSLIFLYKQPVVYLFVLSEIITAATKDRDTLSNDINTVSRTNNRSDRLRTRWRPPPTPAKVKYTGENGRYNFSPPMAN